MTDVRVRGAVAAVSGPGIEDEVAVEEPLEIRVDGRALAVTMRTPGHDEELALGFLAGEGLIDAPRLAGPSDDYAGNVVEVAGPLLREPSSRSFYTTSSCGVCGKGALEEVAVHAAQASPGPVLARALVADLPARLRQPGFERTGGLHATGLFEPDGTLACAREDVGRHNAMDKVVGWALARGELPLHPRALCVSGRLSFELVQKAAVAGAPLLVGVGAPTSLAVRLAQDRGLTLCGFARGGRVNVYTHPEPRRTMIFPGRYTAAVDGDFVVFRIGMRVNKPLKVRSWGPIFLSMPRMLRELEQQPELGLLGAQTALTASGPVVTQWWRSFAQLEAYARAADSAHLPAWRAFNQRVRASGDVGIWHETYRVRAGEYEAVYGNMPRVGLAAFGEHVPAGSTSTAARRIGDRPDDVAPLEGY